MGGDHAPDAILTGCVEALPLLAEEEFGVMLGLAKGGIGELLQVQRMVLAQK